MDADVNHISTSYYVVCENRLEKGLTRSSFVLSCPNTYFQDTGLIKLFTTISFNFSKETKSSRVSIVIWLWVTPRHIFLISYIVKGLNKSVIY